MGAGSILGHAVLRLEDAGLLRGETQFLADVRCDRALHVVFVRATVAHAVIVAIDPSAAGSADGVRAVYTAANLPMPRIARSSAGQIPATMGRPPLASGKVRFVGDIVAAVVAESRAQAVDAAEQVVIDYDPLPTVVDPLSALAEDSPLLFEEHGSNIAFDFPIVGGSSEDDVLEDADVIVEARFINQRLAAVPIEPNGVLIEPADDGALTVTAPAQMPFDVRDTLAELLQLDVRQIRVVAPAVGGGFGAKTGLYPEYLIAAAAALRLHQPVRWTETRSENMVAMTHGRGQIHDAAMGLRRDGTITGLRVRIVQDVGAYPTIGCFMPRYTTLMAQGVYAIPKIAAKAVSVATNATPISAYRGAGRPEATMTLERLIDIAAYRLNLDPVEIRLKNFLPADAFPFTTVTGANYDVGDFHGALNEACGLVDYDGLRAEQQARRQRDDVIQLGIGVCAYIEVTAGAGRVREHARVEVGPGGVVNAAVGTAAQGQGHQTTYAMILNEVLGIPIERIRLAEADTGVLPLGHGTIASRSIQIGGSALHQAGEHVLGQARRLAARLLEADPVDIVVNPDATLGVAGVPSKALSWSQLVEIASDPSRRPPGWEGELAAATEFVQSDATYPFGAHIAVVEVDTETGDVRLLRHVAVDDCGRVLNPTLVAGQVHGGIAQGVAQALYEGIVYDTDGNPLTSTLVDYAVPSAAELPSFLLGEFVTPTSRNPLGAKGIGESGTMGSTPAVVNAVIDALAPLGVRHIDMPLTPERVWRALQSASPGV